MHVEPSCRAKVNILTGQCQYWTPDLQQSLGKAGKRLGQLSVAYLSMLLSAKSIVFASSYHVHTLAR